MLAKYNYYKAFGSNKDYDEMIADEADALLIIHAVVSETESKVMELNMKKNG